MFKDSAIIFYAIQLSFFYNISNSSNVYLSSSRFWTGTSVAIFYQLPFVSKLRMPRKNVWSVQSVIPISIFTNTSVSVPDRPALKQNFMATLLISAIHDV